MPGAQNGLILGIDPGLASTGFALLSEPNLVLSCSTVVTRPGRDGERLVVITQHLRKLLDENPPAEASLEELFMGRNATSAVAVAQARGAILAVLRLMESLEEDDDVQQVYANFDIPNNVLERVSAQV